MTPYRLVIEGRVQGEPFVVEEAASEVLPAEGEPVAIACEADGITIDGAFVVDRIGSGSVPTVFVRPQWTL